MLSILKLLLILLYISFSHGQPKINIGNTTFVGTYMSTRKNRTICAFFGIPFAEPPIGNLRFKNPVPKKELNGVFLANKETADCLQPMVKNFNSVIGEEDCLTLNVYKPKSLKNQQKKLPVMVFFHPGYYSVGGAYINSSGPQYLLDKNIILVTLRFRLGILGFLSTGDSEAPGNFGLKDQIVALQWVKKNIQFFGGDSGRVTLFGSSVGANSIHFHTLSNAANGLFHQCILQAGSAFYSRSFMPRERTLEYAKKAGAIFNCPSNDSRLLIVECLRNVDAINITRTFSFFNPIQTFTKTFYLPTNEPDMPGAYLTDDPFDLIEKKKLRDYPTIVGLNADEGLFWTSPLYSNPQLYDKILGNLDNFLNNFFENFQSSKKNSTTLVADVKKFYFENKESHEKHVILEKVTRFLADFLRNYPQLLGVNFHLRSLKQPLYMYVFNYQGSCSHTFRDSLTSLGVSHADELFYLFPKSIGVDIKPNAIQLENDFKIIETVVDFWTSFATSGVPKSIHVKDSFIWTQYEATGKKILKIGNRREPTFSFIHSLFEDRMNFWKQRYFRHF